MPLVGIWRREEQWSGTWRCEGALNSRSMLGCALGCRWECPALPVACRRRLLSWLFGRALPHSPVNHAKAEREKSSAGLPACGEREHASLRQGQQGVAVLHFLKMRRQDQRGKEKGSRSQRLFYACTSICVASRLQIKKRETSGTHIRREWTRHGHRRQDRSRARRSAKARAKVSLVVKIPPLSLSCPSSTQ